MEIKNPKKSEKIRKKYLCEICNYNTCDKKDFSKHCSTRKHKMEIMEINGNDEPVAQQTSGYSCSICGKKYATNAGLWKHNKKCLPVPEETNANMQVYLPTDDIIKNYIVSVVEQNAELKNMFVQQNTELQEIKTLLAEQPAQISTINNIQNNIHNNKTINNQFNLNVFLQEKCKDALNMNEFIDTLQINTDSVEYTGTHGYVNGITKIFMDGLNQLDTYKRPIHCTDLKRETLYIKEEDKWEKDTEDKAKFKQVLDTVANRNMAQVRHWEEKNPLCKIPETAEYEFYFVIARQSLGGGDHTVTARNNDRILKAIAKEVCIDKKMRELGTV